MPPKAALKANSVPNGGGGLEQDSFGMSYMRTMGWQNEGRPSQAPIVHETSGTGFARLKEAEPLQIITNNIAGSLTSKVVRILKADTMTNDSWIDLGCVYGNLLSVDQNEGNVDLTFETADEAKACCAGIPSKLTPMATVKLLYPSN